MLLSLDLLSCVVSHILEHSNCGQIVVDVAACVAGVHVDGIEDSHEVLLAESVDVVADYQLEASEATSHHLVALMFQRLTNGHDNDPPSFIPDLLSTVLDDLLKTLDHAQLVTIVIRLELLCKGYQDCILPRVVYPSIVS